MFEVRTGRRIEAGPATDYRLPLLLTSGAPAAVDLSCETKPISTGWAGTQARRHDYPGRRVQHAKQSQFASHRPPEGEGMQNKANSSMAGRNGREPARSPVPPSHRRAKQTQFAKRASNGKCFMEKGLGPIGQAQGLDRTKPICRDGAWATGAGVIPSFLVPPAPGPPPAHCTNKPNLPRNYPKGCRWAGFRRNKANSRVGACGTGDRGGPSFDPRPGGLGPLPSLSRQTKPICRGGVCGTGDRGSLSLDPRPRGLQPFRAYRAKQSQFAAAGPAGRGRGVLPSLLAPSASGLPPARCTNKPNLPRNGPGSRHCMPTTPQSRALSLCSCPATLPVV